MPFISTGGLAPGIPLWNCLIQVQESVRTPKAQLQIEHFLEHLAKWHCQCSKLYTKIRLLHLFAA